MPEALVEARARELWDQMLHSLSHQGISRDTYLRIAGRSEDEIVTDTAAGGRNTFKNAGSTRRVGAELLWDGELPWGLHGHVALTWIRAVFTESFVSGAPPLN